MTRRPEPRGRGNTHASSASANDSTKALISAGAACAVGLSAFVAAIACFPAYAESSDIVILRGVEPRIAYRGVPTEDLPVTASVEPFPTARFGQQTDAIVTNLTDRDLAAAVVRGTHTTGTPGFATGIGNPITPLRGQMDTLGSGGLAVGVGAPTGIAGQVTQATGAMTGSLMRALTPLGAGGRP